MTFHSIIQSETEHKVKGLFLCNQCTNHTRSCVHYTNAFYEECIFAYMYTVNNLCYAVMLCKLSLHDTHTHTWHMADSETETQRRRKRAKFIYLKFICVTRFCLFWPNKNIDDYLMLCVPCFANLYLQNCLLKGLDFMSCIFYSWTVLFCENVHRENIQYCVPCNNNGEKV